MLKRSFFVSITFYVAILLLFIFRAELFSEYSDVQERKSTTMEVNKIRFKTTTTDNLTPTTFPITIAQVKSSAVKYLHQRPFLRYVRNLSLHQLDDIVRQVGVDNLTLTISKRQFVFCPVFSMVRRKGSPSDHVVLPHTYQKCKKMSFQNSGTPTALVSYPGSGNSWARILLETSTGIYTGSVYCDKHYLFSGMIGEGVASENVIAIKTHLTVKETVRFAKKVIYIVRNPIGAIAADYTRIAAKGHTAQLSKEHFGTNSEWDKAVRLKADEWRQHIEEWIQSSNLPTIVLCYEEMVKDVYKEIKKMLEFIKYPYTEDDIQCTVKSTNERFHRKHKRSFDPYTPEQRDYVMKQIASVNHILKQYNINYM